MPLAMRVNNREISFIKINAENNPEPRLASHNRYMYGGV